MKRAKVMLSAIAVFAIVGGALAFKAHRSPLTFYTTGSNPATCDNPVTLVYTLDNPSITIDYTTTPAPAPCSIVVGEE